ncbi:MAG: hypothetical protein U1A78_26940 [Polyangia bacterium]
MPSVVDRILARVLACALACIFTGGLHAPSLPDLPIGPDRDEHVTTGQAAPAAIVSFRHGRPHESARKAPLLAILPCFPCLHRTLHRSDAVEQALLPRFERTVRSRSSRGPPASA